MIETAFEQHGYVSSNDAASLGVDTRRLADMVTSGQAERVARGLYRLAIVPRGDLDVYMLASKWPRGMGVISHESAAQLYELNNLDPVQVDVTVPRGFRSSMKPPTFLRLHREDLLPEEVTVFDGVPIVTVGKSISQMIEIGTRTDQVVEAIETAWTSALISSDQRLDLMLAERSANG